MLFTVRPWQAKDLADCLALFDSNVPRYLSERERPKYHTWLLGCTAPTYDGAYLVLEQEGKVLGAGGWERHETIPAAAWLTWGVLHSLIQHQGIGSAWVWERLGRLVDLGIVEVWIDTLIPDFFARFGFVMQTHTPDYYAPGYGSLDMRVRLNAEIKAEIQRQRQRADWPFVWSAAP